MCFKAVLLLSCLIVLSLVRIECSEGLVFPSNNPLISSLKDSNLVSRMVNEATSVQSSKFSTCYGSIIDAGSSGSRIYVYSWDCRTKQTIPNIQISQVAPNYKKSGGIAKLAKPYNTTVPAHLNALVTFAKGYVPENQTQYTPIVFSATAGMRLMTDEDSKSMMVVISAILSQSGFYFQDSFASVISGVHEGVFGWLTTNYIQNRINAQSKTSAVLDLGGASFQITFNPTTKPTSELFTLNLANMYQYDLYSHSFLGFGNDEARNAVLGLSGQSTPGTIVSPCFNVGYNSTGALASDASVRVVGSGNPDACRALIRQFLNVGPSTTINGLYFPGIPSDMEFLGMSSVGYLTDYMGLSSNVSIATILSSGNALCQKDYAKLTSNGFQQTYCFLAMYSYELLSTALKLPDSKIITSTNTVNNFSITYVFGNMMYYVSLLPCNLSFENCIATVSAASGNSISILVAMIVSVMVYMFKFNN